MYHIHVEVGNSFCCQDWETFPVDRNTYFSNELNERETQVSFSFLLSKVLIFSTYHCIMYTWMLLLQRTLSDFCLWIEILVLKISKGKGDFISLFFLRKRIKKAMHNNIEHSFSALMRIST